MRCERAKDIEVYCDLYTPGEVPEYFFDRWEKWILQFNYYMKCFGSVDSVDP
jgi:hypothetical protein